MSERISGVVKWFNQADGYGYINTADGRDVMVRREAIEDGTFLTEGLRVTFVLVDDDPQHRGRLRAEQVNIVE